MRPLIAFDVETAGTLKEYALQPWRVRQGLAWISTMALAYRDTAGEVRLKGQVTYGKSQDEVRATLLQILRSARAKKARIVCWNTTFDCAWVMAYGLEAEAMECDWLDGMLLWKHVEIEPTFAVNKKINSYSLKRWVDAHTNEGGYEYGMDYNDMSPDNLAKLLRYNKDDCRHTLRATEGFLEQLDKRRRLCAITEAYAIPLVASANLRGVRRDDEKTQALDAKLDLYRASLHSEMAKLGVTEDMVRSPAKLGTLLFKKWGLPVIKRNEPTAAALKKAAENGEDEPEGKPSTDKEVLYELALDHPNVEKIGKWREAMNLRGKFVTRIREAAEYNGEGDITHPECRIFGTYTSRCTYSSNQGRGKSLRQTGFALHQMKRGPDFRSLIIPPDGYLIVEFDAAGQEFRWMAVESGDVTMLSLCAPGEDAHSFMGSKIAKRDYQQMMRDVKNKTNDADNIRKGGKVANLSMQYRTSKRRLRIVSRVQYNIPMTEDEAAIVHSTYRQAYPGVPIYWKRQIQLAKTQGWIENLAGRRVEIRGDWTGDNAYSMEQTAINYPIQGVGGEQKYLALRVIRNHLPTYNAHFALDLHDGLFFYVPIDKAMKFATDMQQLLGALPYRQAWGFAPPIPLPFDAKIGPSWGTLKEI